jgi:CO/xanthine dehydrogenase Mo-binding subunit
MTLFEEITSSHTNEMNTNFMTYKIPCRKDNTNIRVAFADSYEPTGPFGAKSIGEIVINTAAPAIAQAVFNATGKHFRTLPITPEKVFTALQEGK